MEILITIGLFISLPRIYRFLLDREIDRKLFSFISSLLLGLVFFVLSIIFPGEYHMETGVILLLIVVIFGYPIQYLLYPFLMTIRNRKK